jgi:hypothetical protein
MDRQNELQETDYKPTKGELFALFTYWWREHEQINFEAWRDQGGISSSEWQEQMDANARMEMIEKLIGEESANRACKQAREDFKREISWETYRVWTEGTEEEVAEFHRKLREEMSK